MAHSTWVHDHFLDGSGGAGVHPCTSGYTPGARRNDYLWYPDEYLGCCVCPVPSSSVLRFLHLPGDRHASTIHHFRLLDPGHLLSQTQRVLQAGMYQFAAAQTSVVATSYSAAVHFMNHHDL